MWKVYFLLCPFSVSDEEQRGPTGRRHVATNSGRAQRRLHKICNVTETEWKSQIHLALTPGQMKVQHGTMAWKKVRLHKWIKDTKSNESKLLVFSLLQRAYLVIFICPFLSSRISACQMSESRRSTCSTRSISKWLRSESHGIKSSDHRTASNVINSSTCSKVIRIH